MHGGKSRPPATEREREARQFWAVCEQYQVKQVTGYDCRPNNPDYWWVPEQQSSMMEGVHLFPLKQPALRQALGNIAEQRARLLRYENVLLAELEAR